MPTKVELLKNNKLSKYLEILNPNLIRCYERQNDTSLYGLNDVAEGEDCKKTFNIHAEQTVATLDDFVISSDENLNIRITQNGRPYFEEYRGQDTEIKIMDQVDDLAALEGHATKERIVTFKARINFTLFSDDDKIYGLGDKAAQFNRRDYEYISWNTDDPTQHNETYRSLYKSINFIMVTHDDMWYGIFYPSTHKTVWNLGKYNKHYFYFGSEKGENDYFLILGSSPAEIVKTYYRLIGRQLFTTLKFMGAHQSRWSYTEEQAREMVRHHREDGWPLDFIHFDIDYMDRYKVYTVDQNYISDFKTLTDDFKKDGVGIITIIDPAVKLEEGYNIYDHLTENKGFAQKDGEDYVNAVWPGDSKYPNYFKKETRDYLTRITEEFMDRYGVQGIWGDMNEPASFNGPLPDDVEFVDDSGRVRYHNEVHNLYAEYMSRTLAAAFTNNNKRPTVITRAGFATTSRYTTSWNGDNQSLWDHLRASLPQLATMNMSGFAMNSVDVGGFGNECSKELLIRWTEANIFMPYFRNHSCKNTRFQEPYAFDDETYDICKKYYRLRYDLMPYLYDLQWQAHVDGSPMIAPLFYYYPCDKRTLEENTEVMIGKYILHAPILCQGQKSRIVYFPEGRWVDLFAGKTYEGGKEYIVEMELGDSGIFAREGALLPMYRGLTSLDKKKIDCLYIHPVVGEGRDPKTVEYFPYVNHEDDGESLDYMRGIYNETIYDFDGERLTATPVKSGYKSDYKKIEIIRKVFA